MTIEMRAYSYRTISRGSYTNVGKYLHNYEYWIFIVLTYILQQFVIIALCFVGSHLQP